MVCCTFFNLSLTFAVRSYWGYHCVSFVVVHYCPLWSDSLLFQDPYRWITQGHDREHHRFIVILCLRWWHRFSSGWSVDLGLLSRLVGLGLDSFHVVGLCPLSPSYPNGSYSVGQGPRRGLCQLLCLSIQNMHLGNGEITKDGSMDVFGLFWSVFGLALCF